MSNVYREAANVEVQNRNVLVGTTAVKINPFEFRFVKGILLRTPGTQDPTPNIAPVWIGSSIVTADLDIETGGFALIPGSAVYLPVEFLTKLYAISTQASQYISWLGV